MINKSPDLQTTNRHAISSGEASNAPKAFDGASEISYKPIFFSNVAKNAGSSKLRCNC